MMKRFAAARYTRQNMKGGDMRINILATAMAVIMCLLFSGTVPAQNGNEKSGGPGTRDAREKPGEAVSLTDAQKSALKSILSKYNASTLTAVDAKAIHSAFRDAGIRGGPGINEAVRSAGFDPDKLRDLDPPPGKEGSRGMKEPVTRP